VLTRNGERYLDDCLAAVFSQKCSLDYNVVVVDSGSHDKTLSIVNDYPVTLVHIKPQEFGHGKTRNLGASLSDSDFLVYLTQDAVPASQQWLQRLVENVLRDPQVAGVYSRWLPRPDCQAPEARYIAENFGPVKHIRWINLDSDWRRNMRDLIFFSNVSSCIRKEVWKRIQFDERLNFGEDQSWAKKALEAGYSIIYEPGSLVYHSHSDVCVNSL